MPSLRKRVTTYLRQLSFSAEPRDRIGIDRTSINKAGCSITRYIEGDTNALPKGPIIHHGKTPQSLPDLPIASYSIGAESVTAACTGPGEGLTCVKRSCLHLSAGPDIDFIDKPQSLEDTTPTNENSAEIQNNSQVAKDLNNSKDIIHNTNKLEDKTIGIASDIENNDGRALIKNAASDTSNIENSKTNNKIEDTVPTESNKGLNSITNHGEFTSINTSDTDSQSSVDTSLSRTDNSNTELSKKEKEKLRLRNLPKYECRRTKTLSETVLTRPRRNIKPTDNTQSIVLVTKTLQVSSDREALDNRKTENVIENNTESEKEISKEPGSIEANVGNQKSDVLQEKLAPTEIDVCNANIESTAAADIKIESLRGAESASETIAGVSCWDCDSDHAYGISTSLYEHNPLLGDRAGQPIADCYGLVARGDSAALALADGVNWGNGAKLAACSAVHGCLSYLNKAIFGLRQGEAELTTQEVFISLLRSFWEAHACIIESGGALCTLTAVVILPLSGKDKGRSVVCACNVGDSLAYVYSHVYGVREITQGSHDINSMRDMRDALGALGPVNGTDPELNNLTLSMTIVEPGDLVFLTSDGISDNFDPVVGRFAEPMPHRSQENPHLRTQTNVASKKSTENKASLQISKSSINKTAEKRVHSKTDSNLNKNAVKSNRSTYESANRSSKDNVQPFSSQRPEQSILKSNVQTNKSGSRSNQNIQEKKSVVIESSASRPKYSRSHTSLEPRNKSYANQKNPSTRPAFNRSMSGPDDYNIPRKQLIPLPRSKNGLPVVNGLQRHDLTLLRMADLLNFGINGMLKPCTTSKALCKLLIDFVRMITTGKRKMLEEKELYYNERNGLLVELTRSQQKSKRKEWIEKEMFKALPGKLDHASVVAYTIGVHSKRPAYCETNF